MVSIALSNHFREWLVALKDQRAKARILARIRLAELGNFGDFAAISDGIFEMRIHDGPGYRLYYARQGEAVYLLLAGGDKSTQRRDIKRAIDMWRLVRKEKQ